MISACGWHLVLNLELGSETEAITAREMSHWSISHWTRLHVTLLWQLIIRSVAVCLFIYTCTMTETTSKTCIHTDSIHGARYDFNLTNTYFHWKFLCHLVIWPIVFNLWRKWGIYFGTDSHHELTKIWDYHVLFNIPKGHKFIQVGNILRNSGEQWLPTQYMPDDAGRRRQNTSSRPTGNSLVAADVRWCTVLRQPRFDVVSI